MDVDLIQKFVIAVAPGTAICAACLWAAARWRGNDQMRARQWAVPLALGAAVCAAFLVINRGRIDWPPDERWQWLAMGSLVAVSLAVMSCAWSPWRGGRVVPAIVAGIAFAVLLHPTPAMSRSMELKIALGALVCILAMSLKTMTGLQRGPSGPLALCVSFVGAALITFQSGFATLSLIIWAAAIALAVTAIMAWRFPELEFAPGGAMWCAAMLPMLLAIAADDGYNTGHVLRWCFAIIAASPLMLWLAEMSPLRTQKTAPALLLRVSLVAAPVTVAVVMAMNSD